MSSRPALHLLEKELESALSVFRGACDGITIPQVRELLDDVDRKAERLDPFFTELEQSDIAVTGQYKGRWRWQNWWFTSLWQESASTNDINGYTGISLVRKKVYNSAKGKQMVYVRTTTPAFPVLVTVRAGARVYHRIGALHIVMALPEKTAAVSLAVTPLPFGSFAGTEERLEQILKILEQISSAKYANGSVYRRKGPTISPLPRDVLEDVLKWQDRWTLDSFQISSRRFLQLIRERVSEVCLRHIICAVFHAPNEENKKYESSYVIEVDAPDREKAKDNGAATLLFSEFMRLLRGSYVAFWDIRGKLCVQARASAQNRLSPVRVEDDDLRDFEHRLSHLNGGTQRVYDFPGEQHGAVAAMHLQIVLHADNELELIRAQRTDPDCFFYKSD